ncbi:hypothetical protein [Streptomyces sp. NBC_00096]|uniref:hypothetical protein n=1 Tax=Streptomyces sp. NBC_00096 TaxID=2975650 RepID=UPI003249799D
MTTQSTPAEQLGEASGRLSRERRELAQDIARHVVTDLAPREARHFEQRARAHFRPRRPWSGRRTTRFDPLGLPAELLTPAALAVATALLGAVSTEVVAALGQRTRSRLSRRGRRRARAAAVTSPQAPGPDARPDPTAAELLRWHTSTLEAARGCRLPEELARRVANAALAHLVQSLGAGPAPVGPGSAEDTAGTAPEALPSNSSYPSDPSDPSDPSEHPHPPVPPSPPGPPGVDGPPPAER